MSFKPIDPKRDECRRYLERVGLIESLTKVFVRILRIRPDNPIEYLLANLGEARLHTDNLAELQEELDAAHQEIQRLRAIVHSINPELLQQSPPAEGCGGPPAKLEPSDNFDDLQNVDNKMLNLSVEAGEGNDGTMSNAPEPNDPADLQDFNAVDCTRDSNANADVKDHLPASIVALSGTAAPAPLDN